MLKRNFEYDSLLRRATDAHSISIPFKLQHSCSWEAAPGKAVSGARFRPTVARAGTSVTRLGLGTPCARAVLGQPYPV